jgi:hypothetical protein
MENIFTFSPECPNYGYLQYVRHEAAATIAPKSFIWKPALFSNADISIIFFPTNLPKERPTTET